MTSSSIGRPPSSNGNGPSSIISAVGSGSKKRLPENPMVASASANAGDGWQTVGAVQPNKFQMKKSPQKKFIEVGTTVICIHTKVRICFYFSSFWGFWGGSSSRTTIILEGLFCTSLSHTSGSPKKVHFGSTITLRLGSQLYASSFSCFSPMLCCLKVTSLSYNLYACFITKYRPPWKEA